MRALENVIQFPAKRVARQKIRHSEGPKYFSEAQIRLLRRTARDRAALALARHQVNAIRQWLLIDLLTSSGVRVAEAVNVRCGDLRDNYGESSLYVRNGKGHRSRVVVITDGLKRHIRQFITWKEERGEPVDEDAHLFVGERGVWTSQAAQQVTKRLLKKLGIYRQGMSCHSLRHSYATALYRTARDLQAVRQQLGHTSLSSTQIYAACITEDIQEQVRGLWQKGAR